jgi:hypothetical protein
MNRVNRGFHRIGIVLALLVGVLWTAGAILLWATEGPPDNVPLYGVVSVISGPLIAAGVYLAARTTAWIINGFLHG